MNHTKTTDISVFHFCCIKSIYILYLNVCIPYRMYIYSINRLTPNDPFMGRTTPLTSICCILYIYSTNIGTEYFKHALYSLFFSSKCSLFHNANLFGSCIIHILHTGCAKIKKNNSGAKGLMDVSIGNRPHQKTLV